MKRPGRFDAIVVETTGLADPAPVAQTFFMDDDVRAKTKLDAVVAVVDAKHLPLRLKDSREAEDQIAFADVDPAQQDRSGHAETELARRRAADPRHQPDAPASTAPSAPALPLDQVLDRGAFDLAARARQRSGFPRCP